MITVPFAYSGAPVNPTVSFAESCSLVSQTGLPVFMSRAISRPSTVPTNTLPSPSAAPRLYGEWVCRATSASSSSGKYDQITSPVAPFSANKRL
jgi:hypothetical protein